MKSTRRSFVNGAAAASLAFTVLNGMPLPANAQAVTPEEARQIAEDAYIYGYSLITTDVTRVQMSNVPKVEGLTAPTGQFINIPRYPPADYRGVSAPNADTLYSLGWLDLTEPQVFSHPDMGNRFYLFEVTDLWMSDSESSPSRRTADGKAANYLFTGPGWKGEVPAGMKQFPMATRYMVILGRTYADGTEQDYKAVNELQAQYKITPLSSWGKSYTPVAPPVNPNPGFSMTDKPQPVILAMGTEGYFNLMAKLMGGAAPPAAEDGPMLASMAKIGIVPGKPFEMSKLDPAVQAALKDIPQSALKKIEDNKAALGEIIERLGGDEGTRYLRPRQLHEARCGGGIRLARQPAAGCGLSLHRDRFDGTEADGRKQVHLDLRQGRDAAGQRLLVDHHVHDRPGLVVRSQPAEQIYRQPARQSKVQRRWFADALLPERIAG